MVVTWSDLAKHCPWSKGQPIGNGIYCAPWHSASSYYPIPPEGEWDFVFVWFHLPYYYYYRRSSSKGFLVKVFLLDTGDISLIFQDISMKLGGHIDHGPNSSYHHFWHHMTCCHGIMTENVITKWTNECTNCEVPGRDGQNSFLPWYLAPCPEHFLIWNFSLTFDLT